jgi:hypothetical protein
MENSLIYILLFGYLIFGLVNLKCFLFQRTTRKIRHYSFGTDSQYLSIEKFLQPPWYRILFWISQIRYILIVWAVFLNWKYSLPLFIFISLLKQFYPTNDYKAVQQIKKHVEKNLSKNEEKNIFDELYPVVLEVESKTL